MSQTALYHAALAELDADIEQAADLIDYDLVNSGFDEATQHRQMQILYRRLAEVRASAVEKIDQAFAQLQGDDHAL